MKKFMILLLLGFGTGVVWADCDPLLLPTHSTRLGLEIPQINACNWGYSVIHDYNILDSSVVLQGQSLVISTLTVSSASVNSLNIINGGLLVLTKGSGIGYGVSSPAFNLDFECTNNGGSALACGYISYPTGTALQLTGASNTPTLNVTNTFSGTPSAAGQWAPAVYASNVNEGTNGSVAGNFQTAGSTAIFATATTGTGLLLNSATGRALQIDRGEFLNQSAVASTFASGVSVGNLTVSGSGAGTTQLTEGADSTVFPSQIGVDNFWTSISSHALVGTFNGSASTYTFVISSVTPVAGQCGQWIATGPNAWTLGNIPCTGVGFLGSTQTWTGINAYQSGSFYSSSSTYSGISMVLLSTGVLFIANDFSNFNANVTIASSMSVTASTTTAYEATFSTTSTFNHVAISTNGYVITQGPAPTVSSCGGGTPAVLAGSTNTSGFVTTGTGVFSSCTITFSAPWPNKPSCVIEDDSNVLTSPPKVTTTPTTLTISGVTITAGDVLNWVCFGN